MIYTSPEPTKVCRVCGGTFEYKFLVTASDVKGGVRALCKPCRQKQNLAERKRRAERAKEMIQAELAVRKERVDLVPPRTFNHIKDPATWTGWPERQYVRNNGNTHIPSKGTAA